jgi:hypothetical protein
MNVLNRTVLEVKIGDRFYSLEVAPDSPLQEVSQALATMTNYVNQKIHEVQEAQAKVPQEAKPEEPVQE